MKVPKEVKISVEKQTVIKISGVDKELVSKIAADIKNLKPVEPYKAKGIKEKMLKQLNEESFKILSFKNFLFINFFSFKIFRSKEFLILF